MLEQDIPQIFLSYASPDQARVLPFFDGLKQNGFNVWIDCRCLMPGQNWDFELKRALEKSSLVIIFLSNNSVNRRGYVQREIKIALDKLSEKLIDDIYIVPVLLDLDTTIPDQLKSIQCIRAGDPECVEKVSDALRFQLGKFGVEIQKIQREGEFRWKSIIKKESWDGLPGYEVELQLLEFSSERYPAIPEVGEYIRGDLLSSLFGHRATKLQQMPEFFNYGQDSFSRTNTHDAHCGEPSIKGRMLSIQYAVHWYGAGAAHPNMYFKTYSFLMEPVVHIASLKDIFRDQAESLCVLQSATRSQLLAVRFSDTDEDSGLDADWVEKGTQNWDDFSAFSFRENFIEVYFSPYQVAGYACGPQFAEIRYETINELMKPEYVSALEISYVSKKLMD
jgi:hypothetical protein